MNDDPLVREIRDVRQRLLAESGGDLGHLLDRYKRIACES